MTRPDDDEWEYEYDETETEDIYIPLDLSNVPGVQVPLVSQGKFGHPTLLKSRLRALTAARGQPTEFSIDIPEGQENATMGEVQITGLHTTNPLVMYNGQLLSCHWTATIGTDMFFVKPGTGVGEPLRSLPSVDLISLGSAKLIAKAARLRPRDDLFEDASNSPQTSEEAVAVNHTYLPQGLTSKAMPKETPITHQPSESASTSFLAKLNLAKEKRGEKTRLTISNTSEGKRLVPKLVSDEPRAASDGSKGSGNTTMGGT
ncbi:hypothetical protein IAQ61_004758 [Plenodomus lingam]|uniref:Transcription factor TFIIIC triple barrel domain-containing protein n=1 Tax=Leptosphaeria maculans (strain JN3 / isolate v23.1.3 / race Av1-4-5-6-7-8) TaxID=985895 RepID=E4ZWF9_LEPMJ|nr:hypothetical protein LEMA_P030870.1 [Plenodomus lingam JN3]KAH9874129.1 hypothetical protein IAQ61_004758 [Plenodomus lingam]CBX95935.1 hypothetical protein LEMA_P030870.1 [Plenodomus lingam JN3]